jgi:hypothetical protein
MEFQRGDDDRRTKAFLFSSGTTLRAYGVIVLIDRLRRMIGDCRTVLHLRENREWQWRMWWLKNAEAYVD